MSLLIATSLKQALEAMAAGARPIAGGTDLVVAARSGASELPVNLVAIDRITDLTTIETIDLPQGNFLRIGAAATHAQIMSHPLIAESYSGIADASALVGSPATRNVGTIGGNVMNASPAMDTGAPLLSLGAQVLLASTSGNRTVPLNELWIGPRRTSATPDELCVAVLVPLAKQGRASAYIRLEYRRSMEIAVVGAAATVELDGDGTVSDLSVALSAVGPTILPVPGVAELAIGRPVDDVLLAEIATLASSYATPISDVRASERYRRHTVGVMARRAVAAATSRAAGETIAIPVNRATGIGAQR